MSKTAQFFTKDDNQALIGLSLLVGLGITSVLLVLGSMHVAFPTLGNFGRATNLRMQQPKPDPSNGHLVQLNPKVRSSQNGSSSPTSINLGGKPSAQPSGSSQGGRATAPTAAAPVGSSLPSAPVPSPIGKPTPQPTVVPPVPSLSHILTLPSIGITIKVPIPVPSIGVSVPPILGTRVG